MAACTEVKVHGYEEYCREVEKYRGRTVFALFCGDKNEDGVSWCPDCVKAEPLIRGEMKHLPERLSLHILSGWRESITGRIQITILKKS
ncbi:unnamed protein product [Staurois parvus]|uniref:Thioredoxin domain-containing protein 17 n=1 Tax=Staurois parvus TaxID=386267 RepID=A0ABN9BW65_9NEOB|nr:unnamed protein product [Staurois parvus]